MRITFVTEHYPPDPGGVATSSRRVAHGLAEAGHEIRVLAFDNSRPLTSEDYVSRTAENSVGVSRIGPFFAGHAEVAVKPLPERHRAMFRRRMCEQMLREAKTFRPDVILAFYLLNAGFLSRFISAELELPYVVSVRGNDIGMDAFNADRFSIVQWTLEGAARIVVVNPFLKRRVLAVSPHLAPRTLVISNGVEFGTLLESKDQSRGRLRAATSWDDDQLVVVFVGTLREKKGVVPLLAAIEKVAGQSPIKLLVVGPTIGSLEQQLCGDVWNRLQERGIIHCTGQLARADVPLWTAGGDIIVMPSLDDGLANALLEGMSLGLCPVASRVFADVIIDGENGFLFDSADHGQLAAILKRLADENRTVARGVGRAASDHVRRHHTPTDEAMQYLAVLASVVSGVSCT